MIKKKSTKYHFKYGKNEYACLNINNRRRRECNISTCHIVENKEARAGESTQVRNVGNCNICSL
jgi:hypothetical protein